MVGNLQVVNSYRMAILAGLTWSKTWQTQLATKCRTWVVAKARMPTPAMNTAMMIAERMMAVARANAAPRMTSKVVTSSAATVRRPT